MKLEIVRRNASTLEVRSVGDVTVADVALTRAELERLLSTSPAGGHRFLVMKTNRSTGFSPEVREPVRDLLVRLREAGMEVLISVAASPLTRMTGTTMATSLGIEVRHVAEDDEVDDVVTHELSVRSLPHR